MGLHEQGQALTAGLGLLLLLGEAFSSAFYLGVVGDFMFGFELSLEELAQVVREA
jgi:hypothetical protein